MKDPRLNKPHKMKCHQVQILRFGMEQSQKATLGTVACDGCQYIKMEISDRYDLIDFDPGTEYEITIRKVGP